MKKIKLLLPVLFVCFSYLANGQSGAAPSNFHGAEATLKAYQALYILNQSDDKKIRGIIRNINNAMNDPRLAGKLKVELVAFGDGVEIFKKINPYDSLLTGLQKRGVLLAACENTIKERKISKDEILDIVSYVPSGNGEIIIRQSQGWVAVHP